MVTTWIAIEKQVPEMVGPDKVCVLERTKLDRPGAHSWPAECGGENPNPIFIDDIVHLFI